jgi:hypothetical protein
MSIYALLGIPVPRIAYVLLHQPAAGTPRAGYEAVMREMHFRLAEESTALIARRGKLLRDVSARESQMLRGTLSSFIQTPIRSDDEDVRKIFVEYFDKIIDQVAERGAEGVTASSEGIIVQAPPLPGLRSAEAAGRRHLKDLCFASGKTAPRVYESIFEVEGSRNLDVLEHLVRDRMGIHTSTHGRHVEGNAVFVATTYNLILQEPCASPSPAWGEAVLFFGKPAMTYDDFRTSLAVVLRAVSGVRGVVSGAVWQRKLGLGRGQEFVLRAALRTMQGAASIVDAVRTCDVPGSVIESIVGHGQFFLREYLPLTADDSH